MNKIGNQTPTQSYILPYKQTYGQEAIDLYNSTDRTAQEWQELMLSDILAYNNEDLFVHTKFGYTVPRRNGKNEVVSIREMWGLTRGEHILHTAHRTTTTHAAWKRLLDLLEKTGIKMYPLIVHRLVVEANKGIADPEVLQHYIIHQHYAIKKVKILHQKLLRH